MKLVEPICGAVLTLVLGLSSEYHLFGVILLMTSGGFVTVAILECIAAAANATQC